VPVRHTLLGLLSQQPRYGYELHAAFLALAGGEQNWDIKPAQVYTTLNRLVEAGFVSAAQVEGDGTDERRVYSLTDAGQAELQAWLQSGVESDHLRDAFFLKLMLAIYVDGIDPQQLIQTQRGLLYRELHRVTTGRQAANPRSELAQILLMDKTIMHLEADLRWLDMVETRLDDMQRQPLPQPELRPRGRPRGVVEH